MDTPNLSAEPSSNDVHSSQMKNNHTPVNFNEPMTTLETLNQTLNVMKLSRKNIFLISVFGLIVFTILSPILTISTIALMDYGALLSGQIKYLLLFLITSLILFLLSIFSQLMALKATSESENHPTIRSLFHFAINHFWLFIKFSILSGILSNSLNTLLNGSNNFRIILTLILAPILMLYVSLAMYTYLLENNNLLSSFKKIFSLIMKNISSLSKQFVLFIIPVAFILFIQESQLSLAYLQTNTQIQQPFIIRLLYLFIIGLFGIITYWFTLSLAFVIYRNLSKKTVNYLEKEF